MSGVIIESPPNHDATDSLTKICEERFEMDTASSLPWSDRESLLLALDEELRALDIARRRILEKRNYLTRPCAVPPELLAHIFEMLRYDSFYSEDSARDLITLTHVCRHWRKVALQYATLWTNIPLDLKQELQEMFISRAGTLALSFTHDYHNRVRHMDTIAFHIHRTSSLRLYYIRRILFATLGSHPAPAAPFLETLYLADHAISSTVQDRLFTSIFFEQHTPRLRQLFLIRCLFPWGSNLPSQLTELFIDFRGLDESVTCLTKRYKTEFVLEDFLQSMQNMLVLEHITLIRCLPSRRSRRHVQVPIELPRLRLFTLHASSNVCVEVWRALRIPTTARASFTLLNTLPRTIRDIVSLTRTRLFSPDHPVVSAFAVSDVDSPPSIHFRFSTYDPEKCQMGHRDSLSLCDKDLGEGHLSLKVIFRDEEDYCNPKQLARQICDSISFSTLRYLAFCTQHRPYEPSEWRDIVSQARDLVCLRLVIGPNLDSFLGMHFDTPSRSARDGSKPSEATDLFPALETLSLLEDTYSCLPPFDDNLERLRSFIIPVLLKRQQIGVALKRLEVFGHVFGSEVGLNGLNSLVPDIQCFPKCRG